MKRKLNVFEFLEMKKKGNKIVFLTCYDYPTAVFCEREGIDMLLVGDSLGMCIYGYQSTLPVTMDQMIFHAEAVRRGAPNVFVIGDMPFMSYQGTTEEAIHNAGRFLKEAGMDAIKLEGGRRIINQIRGIVDAGILVMGHIGLTPQSSGQLGGFRAQARTADSAMELILDAKAVEESGAFAILLEAIPPEVGAIITKELKIPVLSIGAGLECDAQLLNISDLLGIFESFTPKFVKKYSELNEYIGKAIREYSDDVRSRKFPEEKHCYRMEQEEFQRLESLLDQSSGRLEFGSLGKRS
jgi:3-methyl-2-oxobutanoate hydroxymethyltransferase